jgi:hypothetical protein
VDALITLTTKVDELICRQEAVEKRLGVVERNHNALFHELLRITERVDYLAERTGKIDG